MFKEQKQTIYLPNKGKLEFKSNMNMNVSVGWYSHQKKDYCIPFRIGFCWLILEIMEIQQNLNEKQMETLTQKRNEMEQGTQ